MTSSPREFEKLNDIADALYTTNALRGRQIRECVRRLEAAFVARDTETARDAKREMRDSIIEEIITASASPAGKSWLASPKAVIAEINALSIDSPAPAAASATEVEP
jgi:hypothetical protein